LSAATTGDAATVYFGYSQQGAASWTAFHVDGSPPYGASFDTTALTDGLYDLRAIVADDLGNRSQSVRAGVRIDNFVPVIVSSAPADGAIVASASSIALTASEDIASLTGITLDGAPAVAPVVSGKSATFNTGTLADGSHVLAGRVHDAAGRSSAFAIAFVVGVPVPAAAPAPSGTAPVPVLPSAPTNFRGTLEPDGTMTLRWEPGRSPAGDAFATVLFVDGSPIRSLGAGQGELNLGPFDPADLRVFSIASIDGAGQASAESVKLRSSSTLAGKTLEEATATLTSRGFALGRVTGSGPVVAAPKRAVLASLGSPIDLVLSDPASPQTKLVFNAVATKRLTIGAQTRIGLHVQTTRAASVVATLVSPRGKRVYRWLFSVDAGARVVRLTMPAKVKRPGRYLLVLTVSSGSETITKSVTIRVAAAPPAAPERGPIEIVLAGPADIRRDLALGLEPQGYRVIAASGDETWDVTGDTARNVQVIVVDADRYGIDLVRDLHVVFPSIRIIALTNDPRRLAHAVRAGATIAVPRTTPPKDLAKLIRRLATRG